MMFPKPGKKQKRKRPGFDTPPAEECQVCGISVNPPFVIIERHHINPVGMGGTWNIKTADPENRIDICKGTGSNHCHDMAQQYEEGYKPGDLRRIKEG